VYKGFGHANNLVVTGHVLGVSSFPTVRYSGNIFLNVFHLFKLFFVKPLAGVPVILYWNHQRIHAVTEKDGFFRFEWVSDTSVPAGIHEVTVSHVSETGEVIASGKGAFFVPHITQLGVISDIDDTFLISHSSTIFKRLWTLFTLNAQSRRAFEGVAEHYHLLEYAETDYNTPNPIFYVSSSEWNLYDYLNEFVTIQKLPAGIFLLSQIKRWYELAKTGKTKHEGKFVRVVRIMQAFPNQRFILLGDNSQKDPEIYASIVEHYPDRIHAVYIRHVANKNRESLLALETRLESSNIPYCLFRHSREAIEHSRAIGLQRMATSGNPFPGT
jgi:phosphatidate phosphatase APP1